MLNQKGHPVRVAFAPEGALTQEEPPRPMFFNMVGWLSYKEVRRCPTLPQGPPCSTIGAESLSFRVRNVTGRFPLAMAAETLETCVS